MGSFNTLGREGVVWLIGFKAIQVYLYTLYEYICSLAVEDKGMDRVEREEKRGKRREGGRATY